MIYGIIDRDINKVVSWYTGTRIAYKAPYADQIRYFHFEVAETYPAGYSLDGLGNLVYNFSYIPPQPSYVRAKEAELTTVQYKFAEMSLNFAVSNSEILNTEIIRLAGLGQLDPTDPVALASFIRGKLDPLVDALKSLHEDIKMHYFWRIEEHIAAVPRDPLLASDERLAQYQSDLLAIVRPS